jgi:prepilin-type N-terminal cleavage/methylation domain-containing protein/prepilin-type processing-associated H-X9-DG protein
MQTNVFKLRAAFTLIELLTVIAIIGVLAAILIPTVGRVRQVAQRAADASNLREIGKAALLYAAEHQDRLPDPLIATASSGPNSPSRYFSYLTQLATAGGLDEASLYFSRLDPLYDGAPVSRVLDPADTSRGTLNADLLARIPSVNLVGGLRLSDPGTTPLAFTRGLTASGAWNTTATDSNQGAYADGGGHVLFLGGHVQYYRRIGDQLTTSRGQPTSDLRQSIRAGGNRRIYGFDVGNGLSSPDGLAPSGP